MKFLNNKNCFIIAEVSANHAQKLDRAIASIKAAKDCGADAVKFQSYTPDTLTIDSNQKFFKIRHPKWGGQTLYQLYTKAYTPWNWFKELKNVADDLGILFFSTAFDKTAVDFLEELNVPIHKIASFELVDLPLIEYTAKTKKPLILSTGMASLKEIKEAVTTARSAGAKDIVLLKCTSSYPADPKDMNLKTIPDLKEKFNVIVGLSDHTLGHEAAIASVVLGARVIEKHFTLSKKIKTADSFFSLDPNEFRNLVQNVRMVEEALGKVSYGPTENEKKSLIFRRSLFVTEDIKKGQIFKEDNVRSIRPANGLAPKYLNRVLGKRATRNLKKGTPLKVEYVQ